MLSPLLAWRFFRGNRQEGLVSLISAISVAGMALAIALLVLVLSVMNGFEKEFRTRILGLAPHAVLRFDQPRSDWAQLRAAFAADSRVTEVRPLSELQALVMHRGSVLPVALQGMESNRYDRVFQRYIHTTGRDKLGLEAGEIILGTRVAEQAGLKIGQHFRLLRIAAGGADASTSLRKTTQLQTVKLVGLLETGTQIDNHLGLVQLDWANTLAQRANAVQGLQLQFKDIFSARQTALELARAQSVEGFLSDWRQDYGNLYAAIQLSRQLVVMLVATIVAVAVFNIFVTLGMVVRHKRNEIAILRTMGMRRKVILRCFLWQGLVIAMPGCLIGAVLGVALALMAPESVNTIQQLLGMELLNTEVYPINYLPAELRITDVTLIVAAALLMSLVATLVPAWQASKMDPVMVLKQQR